MVKSYTTHARILSLVVRAHVQGCIYYQTEWQLCFCKAHFPYESLFGIYFQSYNLDAPLKQLFLIYRAREIPTVAILLKKEKQNSTVQSQQEKNSFFKWGH
jgi:hypothetical protein